MTEDQIRRFVREQLAGGVDQRQIIQELVARGVDKKAAARALEEGYNQSLQGDRPRMETPGGVLPALLGGLLAALLGGGLWALIVVATKSELGMAAWGIGLLCGYAVLLFARGQRGVNYQIVAALSSLLGIFVGKYGTFAYFNQNDALPVLSPAMFSLFFEHVGDFVGGYDLIWVVLALTTAWAIPKQKPVAEIKPAAPGPTDAPPPPGPTPGPTP
jgi:hypothetical protein